MTHTAMKEHAHDLIERMPNSHMPALLGVLEILAPAPAHDEEGIEYEDELVSDEENAQAASAKGPWSTMEEVMSEMGITRADLEHMVLETEPKAETR